jgi:putative ABC transport system substrate-binding protein
MRRREIIKLLGGAAVAWPVVVRAQQPAIPVVGILLVFSRESGRTFTEPLRAYMRAVGYVEGRNIAFDVRYADGKLERLPALATELAAQQPALIATFGERDCARRKGGDCDHSDRVYVGKPCAGENRNQHPATGGQHHR